MEIDMHQSPEGSPRKEVEGSCARGWRELISNIFNCIAIFGIVIRRALSWERPREQVDDYRPKRGEDNFDSISTMSGASNDSTFTITALEDSFTPFHDFGEMGSRNAGQKRRDPYAENFYNFDGKYATISNDEQSQIKPNKIDIRGGSDGEKHPRTKVAKTRASETVPQADVEPVCLEHVTEVQAEVESTARLMKDQKDLSEIQADEKPNYVDVEPDQGVESLSGEIVGAVQEEGTPVDPVQVKLEETCPAEPSSASKEEAVIIENPHTPPKYERKPNRQRKEKLKDSSKRSKHFSPSFSIDPNILPKRGDDMLTFQLKFLQQLQTVSRIASQETQELAETEMCSDADNISNESLFGDSDSVPHLSDDVSEPDPEIQEVSTESPTKEPLDIISPGTPNQKISQGVAPGVKGKVVKTNPTFFVFNDKPTSPSPSSDELTPIKRKLKANRKLTPGKRGKFSLKFPQLGSNCFQRTKSEGESDDDESEIYTKTDNMKNDSSKPSSETIGQAKSIAQDHLKTAQETVEKQSCVSDNKDQADTAPSPTYTIRPPVRNEPKTRSNQIKPFPKDDTKIEPSQTNAESIKMPPCKPCKPVPETYIETNEVTDPKITREVNFFYLNEFNRPVILKAVHGDKIYHLKLKTHSQNKIEFIAYIPHQESQKTLPASRIPVLNPRDTWDFGVRIQNGDGKKVVFQHDLVISVKINGKRLNIPVDEPNIIKLTREFIANPKSSDVNPCSLGQYILNMSFCLLELIEEHKQGLKENASSGSDHEDSAEKPEVPATSSATANNKVSHSYARKASRIIEDIELPQPFQDEYYAERTEQLLAQLEKNAKAYQRKKVEKPQNIVKTFADKFTEIDYRFLGEKTTKRLTCEPRESIGFVPKNEKWIQVDMDSELWKEFGAHHGEPIESSMYSFQVENFDIGAYRIDECVAVEKAKKGQVEILAGKQKVKTRGIPNKHLDKHSQEEDLLDLIMEADDLNDGEEEETVFGNPEMSEFCDQKPIFVEDETTDLDMRHMEETPCKILQKRRSSDPITPVKNKNKKKKHRAHTGPKDMNATQLAQKMFNFSQPYEPMNRPRN